MVILEEKKQKQDRTESIVEYRVTMRFYMNFTGLKHLK